MNWQRLRKKVIEQNYPSDEEFHEIESLYAEISGYIKEHHGKEVHFAGSASRKTCMKGDRDLDIFVMFDKDTSRKELEEEGVKIGKDVFKKFDGNYHVEYAEHPYTKGRIEGKEVEVVPCYDVPADNIKSSVDRTPHHSKWSEENLDEEQRKDVVVLKKFLSVKGLYGSSLKVRGFSGYLCEILIHKYGGFKELLENASDWPEKKLIDPENRHEEGLPEELQDKFSPDNLVVIDPVDSERNVAAVMTGEKYSEFIYEAISFLDDLGMHHFRTEEKEYTNLDIKNEIDRRHNFTVIEMEAPEEVDDILYPQLRKAERRLNQLLEKEDFNVYSSGFHTDEKIRMFFETDGKLPETSFVQGPKLFHGKDHVKQFENKYENTFVEGERLVAKTDREYLRPKEVLADLPKDRKKLEEQGIPDDVARKFDDRRFRDPVLDDQKWLNFLGEELHVNEK